MFNWLPRITGQKIIFPFYHAVSDNAPVHLKPLYTICTPQRFEADIDFLLTHYNPIDVNQLHRYLADGVNLPGNSFLLSFDDGLRDFKDFAWPILKRKGVPVVLFVNTGFVDNKALFFRFKAAILLNFLKENSQRKPVMDATKVFKGMFETLENLEQFVMQIQYPQQGLLDNLAEFLSIDFNAFLQKQQPYLTLKELHELQQEGVHIGAHSIDHPLFNQIADDEKLRQLLESVNWVTQNFEQPVRTFSYPFTDAGISGSFMKQIFNPDSPLVDITFGTAGMKKEVFGNHIQRIPIENYTLNMEAILRNQYLYYLAKAPLFKNTIRRE